MWRAFLKQYALCSTLKRTGHGLSLQPERECVTLFGGTGYRVAGNDLPALKMGIWIGCQQR
jgi:hypothetical protein